MTKTNWVTVLSILVLLLVGGCRGGAKTTGHAEVGIVWEIGRIGFYSRTYPVAGDCSTAEIELLIESPKRRAAGGGDDG